MLFFFLSPWMLLKIFTSPPLPILKLPPQGDGHRGANVRPDFNWDAKPAAMMGHR